MDNIIYNAITKYYKALKKLGYYKYEDAYKLLVLCFLRDFVYNDYRGLIKKSDYSIIERALNCLFGSSCLIPYPDYLKMGKLHLGEVTELASRVKTLENTDVIKAFDTEGTTIVITSDDEETEE